MPVYEYQSGRCGGEFEREQRITDDPVKTCPECRSRKVKKLISQTSFVLKGGGWYSDLYSSQKPSSDGKKPEKESKSDSGKDASADSSKDSKTEKKSSEKKGSKEKGGKKSAA